jgi:hypothetical protein
MEKKTACVVVRLPAGNAFVKLGKISAITDKGMMTAR